MLPLSLVLLLSLVLMLVLVLLWLFPAAERAEAAAAAMSVLHSGHQPWFCPSSHSSMHYGVIIQKTVQQASRQVLAQPERRHERGNGLTTAPHSDTPNGQRSRSETGHTAKVGFRQLLGKAQPPTTNYSSTRRACHHSTS